MKGHLIAIVVLLLGVASYVAERTGVGMALFFVGAAIEIGLWLGTVHSPRRVSATLLARINAPR
jgi:hypothetical protein